MFRKKKSTTIRQRPGSGAASGQKAPNVFSFHSNRSSERSNLGRGQTKKQDPRSDPRRKGWLKRTLRFVAVLALVALAASNLLLNREPKLVFINDEGDDHAVYREEDMYQAAANQLFSSSFFNTNKLTINTGRIESALKQQFPEIADVSISLPFVGHRPIVYLQHSAARLILSSPDNTQTYVLDASGKAVASGNAANGLREAGLPVVRDQSAINADLGEIVLPSTTIAFITEVARQLKAKDIAIASMELPPEPSELHVRLKGVGYYIKFNTRGNAREETGTYLALRQYLEAQRQTPAEYIDVRVANRAYYK